MYNDPAYLILVALTTVVGMLASSNVQKTFSKYSTKSVSSGVNGSTVAQRLLQSSNCQSTRIEAISGQLTDHFDPRSNVVRLSEPVYGASSISALGVAAHECGHVMQHNEGYAPMKIRNSIVPIVSLSSKVSMPLILLGLVLSMFNLVTIGIVLYAASVAFHVITLPVELDASNRALRVLREQNFLNPEEIDGAQRVLKAAAMTYFVSALTSIATLFYFIARSRRRNR